MMNMIMDMIAADIVDVNNQPNQSYNATVLSIIEVVGVRSNISLIKLQKIILQ